jgi:hypothetical protein
VRCTSIPQRGWDYCQTHHDRHVTVLAVGWEQSTDREHTAVTVRLPHIGKRMTDLSREERAALGYLLTLQLDVLELPAPSSTESDTR